ncbi:MAG: hypothetical protein KH370_08105, partial [Collinsella intestinalis]|nr:hypothetical protein [Collinsella intestinalis]
QVIGKEMPHGFAGAYARQPDMIVNTRSAGGDIPFGLALTYDENKDVVVFGNAASNNFIGVAGMEIKSAVTWPTQNGQYAEGEPVSVFMRGSINVKCQRSTPSLGGAVYVRTAVNDTYPGCVVGGFEAEADSGKTQMLGNCQWGGAADANGVAELIILTRANA